MAYTPNQNPQPTSIADGADVAQGTTTNAAITTDSNGTVIGFLRGLVKILGSTWNPTESRLRVNAWDSGLAVNYGDTLNGKPANVYSILGSRNLGWSSTSVLGDACEYLDTSQANMNTPTAGQTLYIVSSSANDTGAGTGAQTVRIIYLDASGNQQKVTKTMNGTTPVSLGTGFTAIQWMEVAAVGSNAVSVGNLAISSTNGAATVATTFEYIAAGGNRSMSGRYMIPTGYSGYILDWSCAAISATMDTRLRVNCFSDDHTISDGAYHFKARVFLASGANSFENMNSMHFPAGSTVKISAIPGSAPAGNKLECGFCIIVAQD